MRKRKLLAMSQKKHKVITQGDEPLIVFTIDDAYLTDYTIAFPLFEQYGIKGTSFAVPSWVGTSRYCDWSHLREMSSSDFWDVQCHTYTHRLMGELSEAELRLEFEDTTSAFEANGLPKPKHLAYPYGSHSQLSLDVAKEYRLTQRGTGRLKSGGNQRQQIKLNPYHFIRATSVDMETEEQFSEIKKAIQWGVDTGKVMVLYCHQVKNVVNGYQYNILEYYLIELVKFIASLGVRTLTISELYDELLG